MIKDTYESPLSARYASKEMKYIFSPDMKFRTWRKLWIALAEAEMELGLPITQEQIDELKEHADDINYEVAHPRTTLRYSSARAKSQLYFLENSLTASLVLWYSQAIDRTIL